MPMQWQDMASMNRKYNSMYMAGLGGGVFDGGSVILPASRKRAVGAAPTGGETFWWNIQVNVNDQLDQLGREQIPITQKPDVPTCAALQWLLEHMPQDAYFREFLADATNKAIVSQGCHEATAGMDTLPVPPAAGGDTAPAAAPTAPDAPASVTTPTGAPCVNGSCDCYVNQGDEGEHITFLQHQLNAALDAAGYEGIPVTGVYDDATCGAVFTLGGSFEPPYPGLCSNPEGEWVVPLKCPDMVLPQKKTGSSKASMFAVGGLVLAAGLGAAYWVSKR